MGKAILRFDIQRSPSVLTSFVFSIDCNNEDEAACIPAFLEEFLKPNVGISCKFLESGHRSPLINMCPLTPKTFFLGFW